MTMLRTLLPLALLALPGLADKVDDVLKVWDANKDGVLTRDEIPDAAIFAKVDKNKDGKATRAEVAAFLGIEQPKKKDRPKNKSGKSTTEAKIKTPRTTREHVADFFRRYDKDKNRKVTKKEFPTGQNVFRDWDRNKDDALTRREVERYIKAELRRLRMRPNANNFFELFDFNRDKKVTRKEYTGPRDFFRRYDHDKNGAVTEKEISMGPDQGRASTRVMKGDKKFMGDGATTMPKMGMLARYDKNKDGRLTLDELDGAASVLARLDKNGDGFLSGSEVR